jgi:hypothetical protein
VDREALAALALEAQPALALEQLAARGTPVGLGRVAALRRHSSALHQMR